MAGARSRRKTGTHFSGSRSNLEFKGRLPPKKEARPKGPGITLLVAAQYIQKSPKNNGLLRRFDRSAKDCLHEVSAIRRVFPDISRRGRIGGGAGAMPAKNRRR
jgi:hypothetical protein